MSFQNNSNHFTKHNFHHHSNPSMPDGYTFFDKGVRRRRLTDAYAVIAGKHDGDEGAAQRELELNGCYTDSTGKTQYNDNPNMMSGRAAEHYCNQVLIDDAEKSEAYSDAMNMLHSYKASYWRDKDTDSKVITHRTELKYGTDGKKIKEPQASEFELVCNNALDGLREATAGDNRIVGQKELRGKLPKCMLPYLGYGDYQEGRVELKTQWDSMAHTDSPRANSLPSDIKEPHLYQISGYYQLTGQIPKIVYANRLGYRVFEASQDQLEFGVARIIEACRRRERLLLAAESTEQLLRLTDPQWSHAFAWKDMNPELLQIARKIWSE